MSLETARDALYPPKLVLDEFDWFTSDDHFGHARVAEARGFTSVQAMNGFLIKQWNSVVGPTDKVCNLGDLNLGSFLASLGLTRALNGIRFKAPGNHDRDSPAFDRGKAIDRFAPIYEDHGWTLLPGVFQGKIGEHDVLFSHYPYEGDSRTDRPDRWPELRPRDEGLPLIHGHVHGRWKTRGRMFNVGVDVNDWRPVHRTEIEAWLDTLA